MGPWVDRHTLIRNAERFVQSHGFFLRKNGHRISSLVEIAVYNSIVQYYQSLGFTVTGENLGPKNSFRYKLTSSGLIENHSYFIARKVGISFHILHNISIQSAYEDHLYFTADIVVANENGATTKTLRSGRRHSFVANTHLVTFAEVKHLNPFPEVLFNFIGLVLEFMPMLIKKTCPITDSSDRLCPVISFTGPGSKHADAIQESLSRRYGVNIVFGTSSSFGSLIGFSSMKKYSKTKTAMTVSVSGKRIITLE